MSEKVLLGKNCIVTGAARGIGKAVAMKYAENGANVAVIDLNEEGVMQTAKEIQALGVKSVGVAADISKAATVDKAMETIFATFDQIDVLANCAGISTSKCLIDVPEDQWDLVMNVNLKSIYLLSKHVAKNMMDKKVKNGKIVNISSQASKLGEYGNGVYCVSKAGVNMITQVLALELAEYGISVSAVCPGYVNTEMIQEVFQKRGPLEGKTPEEYEKELTDLVPLKRLVEPEEIADFMLYLSSDKASYITGVALTIAGGRTLI